MPYSNAQAIKDLLTTGGGVPKFNKIKLGSDYYYCHLGEDGVWSTDTDPGDLISRATADIIKDATINGDGTITRAGTSQVFQVVHLVDSQGTAWCTLADP